jgi:PKD repeat protein
MLKKIASWGSQTVKYLTNFINKKIIFLVFMTGLIAIIALSGKALANDSELTWQPNNEPDIAGYKVSWVKQSGVYVNSADVGLQTSFVFPELELGTYYAAVQAYDTARQYSPYSDVVSFTVEEESAEVTIIPYSEMTLVYVDSEETHREDGRGIYAIDGNPYTMWHTEWKAKDPVHPHAIVIDLGYERQVCGFNYLPRQDRCYNGGIAEYEFYVSVDGENWGSPVASGIFPRTRTKQEVVFYPKYARYVGLVALSEIKGHPWTSAAEIEVMEQIGGHANIAPKAVIHTDVTSGYVPLTVQFDAGGSIDPDGGMVSYQWNFGDGESDIGEAVGHTFQATGEYTVTLTVEDNEGATAQAQITITAEEESAEVTLIPYSKMILVYVDSEETRREDGRGINAIDGNPSTMWHTEWKAKDPVHPHEIVIDLGYERQVCGFNYLPRQDRSYNGGIAEYEFYVSVDSENWGSPVASGIFPSTEAKQEVVFYPKYARYVKLVALSEVRGRPWTSAAEIEVMER